MVTPEHFAPLFERKPRAQVMLYRQALLELGAVAAAYISELSQRQRAQLREQILGVYALLQQHGASDLLVAMDRAAHANAYGADYLRALLTVATTAAPDPRLNTPRPSLWLPGVPGQSEIDRQLALYEVYVHEQPDVVASRGVEGLR